MGRRPALAASGRSAVNAAMGPIKNSPLPKEALLRLYLRDGHYTDCFSTDISQSVTHSQYVTAFYTTLLFKIERLILRLAVSKPSTDTDAVQLAEKQRDTFAAWNVEARDDNQLLLCDFQGRTRSWLMVEPMPTEQGPRTRLYFGSAVVRYRKSESERKSSTFEFGMLLRFHRLYSVALLYSAKKRLES
jgi:hypothetical protein